MKIDVRITPKSCDTFENMDEKSCLLPYMIPLAHHLLCPKTVVYLCVEGIIPATLSVEKSATKSSLKPVESIHGVCRVGVA